MLLISYEWEICISLSKLANSLNDFVYKTENFNTNAGMKGWSSLVWLLDVGYSRANATNLKVGGSRLARVGAQSFPPFAAALKLVASQKMGMTLHPPPPPPPVTWALYSPTQIGSYLGRYPCPNASTVFAIGTPYRSFD